MYDVSIVPVTYQGDKVHDIACASYMVMYNIPLPVYAYQKKTSNSPLTIKPMQKVLPSARLPQHQ